MNYINFVYIMHRTKLTSATASASLNIKIQQQQNNNKKKRFQIFFYDFIMQNLKLHTHIFSFHRKRHSMNTKQNLYYY